MEDTQPVQPHEFERRFSEVLAATEETVWRANIATERVLLPGVKRNSMPQMPVWRLHLGATSTFLGVIQCLKTRYSSLGAFSLLRGVLEAWTHLYFISDESESDTPALRSIRFEAGVLSEWASVSKKMNPSLDYDEIMKRHHRTIMELWSENGGRGEPRLRTYNDVIPTLVRMSKSPALQRMDLLHKASSVAVHMSASDFLMESTGTGVTVVWASEGRRCAWLQLGIMCFDFLTMSALCSVPSAESDATISDLHTRWQVIYRNPIFTTAVLEEGETDR